jgi:hypothetical protein
LPKRVVGISLICAGPGSLHWSYFASRLRMDFNSRRRSAVLFG